MGGLFSSKTKTTSKEESNTGPSKFQQPYLDETFGAAKGIYNETKDTPYYQGDTYAGLSEAQRASMAAMTAYAGGTGMDGANRISSIGNQMITDASGKAMSNLDRFTTMAGEDGTAANIANAGRYADNKYVDGMIDANSRDVTRNLYENQLPGIDRAASGGGNINSSRTGVAAGIAERGAGDRIADISAQLRGDAYNRGLTLAQQDRATQLDAYGRAAEGYSNITAQGIGAVKTGSDMAYDSLGRQIEVDSMDQADRQSELDANFKKWAGDDERKMDLLARYNSIVGSNQWGQSGTASGSGTSKQSGNILGKLAGAAAAVGSMIPCDRRLKDNIVHLGILPDGLAIYAYTYRQDVGDEHGLNLPKGFQIGPMADEVAELRPHAMGPELDGGFLSINLAAL